MMELTGQQLLPVARDRVWSALLDAETLRAAIPGCEYVTEDGEGLYSVGLLASVGPVKARFKGHMRQQDLQPPHRYTLSFEGDSGPAGFAKGSAEVELLEVGEAHDSTQLNYRAQTQIGGRLAQIGSRLIDATAARMSAQFFERLTVAIVTPTRASPAVHEAPATATAGAAMPSPAQHAAAAVAPPRTSPDASAAAPVGVSVKPGMVTLHLPAWAFAFMIAAFVALIGWLSVR